VPVTLAVVASTGAFGGAEATDVHYLDALIRRGVSVRVALPADGEWRLRLEQIGARYDLVESPPELDELSRRYISKRSASLLRLSRATARYEVRLFHWLRNVRPDACLATGFRAQLAVAPVSLALGVPVAWVASDFVPPEPIACRLWSLLARHEPQAIITYSRAAANQRALERSRVVFPVLSGIDLPRYPMGPEDRARLLLMVGHLTPLKNHLGFLDVLRRVRRRLPGTRGIIAGARIYRTAGHSDYADEIEQACTRFDPPEAVSLVSPKAEEVSALMRTAAVLVQISRVPETFGRVVAEAMASGCAVVGYERGATPELVGPAGVLVAPDDLQAVADQCVELLGNAERRLTLVREARKRAESLLVASRAGQEGADVLIRRLGLSARRRPLDGH
jgi:glycosyltransferase involved in cell wall biosynthesis